MRIINFTLLWRWLLVVSSIFVMYGLVASWNRAVDTFAQSSAGSLGDAVGSTMGYGMGVQALHYVGQTFGFHTSETWFPQPASTTSALQYREDVGAFNACMDDVAWRGPQIGIEDYNGYTSWATDALVMLS